MNDNTIKRPLINRVRFGSTKSIVPDINTKLNFHKQIINDKRFNEMQSFRETSNEELIKQEINELINPVNQNIKTKPNVPPVNSKTKKRVTNLQDKRKTKKPLMTEKQLVTKKPPITKKPPMTEKPPMTKRRPKLPPKKNRDGMFKQIKDKFTGNPKDSNKNN